MNDQEQSPPVQSRVRRKKAAPVEAPPVEPQVEQPAQPPPPEPIVNRGPLTPEGDVRNMVAQMRAAGIEVQGVESIGNATPPPPPTPKPQAAPIPLPPTRSAAPPSPHIVQTYTPPGYPKAGDVAQVMNQKNRCYGVLFVVGDVRRERVHGYYLQQGGRKEFVTMPVDDVAIIGDSRVRSRESVSAKWRQES